MIPNLKANDITDLNFSFTLTLSEELQSRIRNATPLVRDGRSVFLDSYQVDGVRHRAWASVEPKDEAAGQFRVSVNYEVGKGGRLAKGVPRIETLFSVLSLVEETIAAVSQVSFAFSKRRRVKPVVALPMRLLQSPDAPFDEIIGVHVTKRDEYNALLDIMDGGELLESVFFTHRGRIQENLVDEVVQTALSISSRLVLRGD